MRTAFYLLAAFLGYVIGLESVSAQFFFTDAIEYVGVDLIGVEGAGGNFGDIFATVGELAILFLNAAAVITIVISGMLAVTAQDENRIANARKVVVMVLIGIVLVNTAAAITLGYLTAFDFDGGADVEGGTDIITAELLGFIAFAETPIVIFAIIAIIVYGLKAVLDYSGDQGLSQFRKALLSILLGLVIIVAKVTLADSILLGDPTGIATPVVNILMTVVSFVALAAVVMIVIAGVYMIANLGNDEQYNKAKGIIVRVIIGIIVMLVAFGLTMIVIDGVFGVPTS